VILAVDPGKTTGFVMYTSGAFFWGQESMMEFLRRADDYLYDNVAVEVVCEKFQIGPSTLSKARDAHWAMKQIGILEYWCETRGHTFTLQTPSEAKSFATDAKLKTLGWYTPTKGGHANDALRHLLVYMVKQEMIDLQTLLGP
jgi:hypothetical protein